MTKDDKQVRRALRDAGRLLQKAGRAWPNNLDISAAQYQAAMKRLQALPSDTVSILRLPVHRD